MTRFQRFMQYIAQAKFTNKEVLETILASMFLNPQSFLSEEGESYAESAAAFTQILTSRLSTENNPTINVTNNFTDNDIPSNSVAYHRMFGPIIADDEWYRWYFSTKKFIRDVRAAEANPKFIAHFLHSSTGGGEAWMLEKAYEAVGATKKPFIEFTEKVNCSAGLYIGCGSDRRFTYTINDTHGSLGVMIACWNMDGYYESYGFKKIEEYAKRSDLKNKKYNDLQNDKPGQYIKEELDPQQAQFETAVRAARPQLNELDKDHPVFRGETFDGIHSLEIGLIDEIAEIEKAVLYAHAQGMAKLEKEQAQALTYIN